MISCSRGAPVTTPILSSVSPCLGDMNITLATRELVLIQLMIHVRQSARTRGIFHPKNPNVPMKLHFMLGSKSLACLELWEVFVLAHCLFFKFPLTSNRKFQVNQPATHQPDRLKTHLRVIWNSYLRCRWIRWGQISDEAQGSNHV